MSSEKENIELKSKEKNNTDKFNLSVFLIYLNYFNFLVKNHLFSAFLPESRRRYPSHLLEELGEMSLR